MRIPLLLMLLLAGALAAQAAPTKYISDQLQVTLRSGQTTQHKILRMLDSGTPVEVLEDDAETGYTRVRTSDGIEGWVLARYLDPQPSGRARLAKAEEKIASLNAALSDLKEKNTALSRENAELTGKLNQVGGAKDGLEQEVARIRRASASALAIDDENKALKDELSRLQREHQLVLQDNEVLKDHTARDWFIVGAGVVLLGMVIGLVIPKIRWRKKSDWSRF